jgi:hypothetical protein
MEKMMQEKTNECIQVTEGDVQATLEFVEHIYNYLPELGFATLYVLVVYAAFIWIKNKLKD